MLVPKVEVIEKSTSPRVIKSHLPFSLLHSQLLETSKVRNYTNEFLCFTILAEFIHLGSVRRKESKGCHRVLLLPPQIVPQTRFPWRR